MIMQHQQQPLNTTIVSSGNGGSGEAMVSLMSTTALQSQSRPAMLSSSYIGPSSLLGCCRFWSLTPNNHQTNYHNQVSWMKLFSSERFRVVSLLLKCLIACVLLNLLLTSWIIISLRLHKNNNPFRYGNGQRNSNSRRSPVTLTIDGSLIAEQNLQLNTIEVANSGIFGVASTEDQLTLSTKNETHRQSSFGSNQLPQSITLSGQSFEMKTTNLAVEEMGEMTFQLTPTTLSFKSSANENQQLKAPPGGLRLAAKLDTSEVRSNANHEFHIESRTGALQLFSQHAIEVESMSSGSSSPSTLVQSFETLQLNVVEGNGRNNGEQQQHHLHFDSANVQMGHLRGNGGQQYEEQQQQHHHHFWRHQHHHQQTNQKVSGEEVTAYQLCVCGSGHLFATAVESVCEADQTVCAS